MRTAIQVLLGVAALGLTYVLYHTIVDPWNEYEATEFQTELTRARMSHARTALISFRDENGAYPPSLDSLVYFVKSDSAFGSRDLSEVFIMPGGGAFVADSLPFSPRTGTRFEYELVSDDTSGVTIYYVKDPDSADHIGAQEANPASRNVASWE